ncbi:MAG TPA: hypothetical protein VLS93_09070, partial [Anaeromyxobacteraceae bacterium]|nr:hypothetical protein [Anaeromyxobacteraceae bacterium]
SLTGGLSFGGICTGITMPHAVVLEPWERWGYDCNAEVPPRTKDRYEFLVRLGFDSSSGRQALTWIADEGVESVPVCGTGERGEGMLHGQAAEGTQE